MLGDVGQIEVVQANIRVPSSVERALDGAQACINAVGVLYESGRQGFQSLQAMGAKTIAAACVQRGIDRFVQISAIGADAASASKYAQTKAAGEAAVRALIPSAIIIRPSIVFGPEDDFFNRFAAMASIAPALPLIGGGQTLFQPVFVGDVAAATVAALGDASKAGQTFELGGPAVYSFRSLLELILRETGHKRLLVPVPWPVASLIGMAGDLQAKILPMAPVLTSDQVILLKSDNITNPALPGLAALGIEPTAVEAIVPSYLYRYRKGGQYADLIKPA
jgi:NADH dehydrogenase